MVSRRELVSTFPSADRVWDAADALFPVRVTRSWWSRVRTEDPDDPLARQVLPSAHELVSHERDLDDPVGDSVCSPSAWVVHKYPDRILLMMTKRCHLYCRYCFRRTHAPEDAEDPSPDAWNDALRYAVTCGATEAILSGGDPLACRDSRIFETIDTLRDGPIRWVRIHTRAPITMPARVTRDLVDGLAARGPVWVVVHCNHPRELSPEVDEALARLVGAGIPVLNQAVLLRGVNDNPEILAELCNALVERRVRPYYLHHTDEVTGNASFRVSLDRGLAIYRQLAARVGGLARPRYVIDPPDGSGKVDVEAYVRAGRHLEDGRTS